VTVVAGVDIGNATTEVVVARLDGTELVPVAWDRTMTRGGKGSQASVDGAAALLRRLERQGAPSPTVVALARLRPVGTEALVLPEPPRDTGRLLIGASGVPTAGGTGQGMGRPVMFADLAGTASTVSDADLIVLVPERVGFRVVAKAVSAAVAAGLPVRGVVLSGDEAVLVANRLPADLPVVDQADVAALGLCRTLIVEVRPAGQPVRAVSDALHLSSSLALGPSDAAGVSVVCRSLFDVSNAVVGVREEPMPPAASIPSAWVQLADGATLPMPEAHLLLRAGPPGLARRLGLPAESGDRVVEVDDLGTVHLGGVADAVVSRSGSTVSRSYALSALHRDPVVVAADRLAEATGLRVVTVDSEAASSRRGALTTPGTTADCAVVDLGGGTVDVTTTEAEAVVAGAGDLLTVATAATLGLPRGAAEWVKRVPCHRVETPHLLVGEDGSRAFVDGRLPGDHVGSLAVPGPAGWLAFDRSLAAAEWRALRLALKREVLGGAVRRALRACGPLPSTVVLVGGPAGDDEAVATVARVLPAQTAVGRGDVAGALGHRYAVAFGLALGATARHSA
jgi:hypothetical protein